MSHCVSTFTILKYITLQYEYTGESVSSGSIKVAVKDSIIPISTTLDLCTTIKEANAGLSCPLLAQVYAMNITQKIPVLIPVSKH